MKCEEFDARMQAILDRRGDPGVDETLRRHALTCPNCCSLLNALLDAANAWDLPQTPRVPMEAVRRKPPIQIEQGARLRHPHRTFSWLTAILCATVVVGLLTRIGDLDPAFTEVIQTEAPPDGAPLVAAPTRSSLALDQRAEGLPAVLAVESNPMESLGSGAIGEVASTQVLPTAAVIPSQPSELFVGLSISELLRNSSQLFDSTPLSRYRPGFVLPAERLWPGPVTGSLRPVAESFSSTYNVLRSRWPI